MKKLYSKNTAVIIITLIIILFACKKEKPGDGNGPVSGTGNGSVQGAITDVNNSPVSNATVTGGTATAITDANGKFTLSKVQFSDNTVLVTVTKDGFFEGSKKFTSSNNAVSNAKIQLIPKTVSGTIAASSGGNVTIQGGGGSVNFTSGFVTASSGNVYSGNVSVSAHYLDPADQNFSVYAPGDLKAVSANNPQGTLQSFGVIAVEMNDATGNNLQLASGKTATITLPISSALLSKAPASVPLWYFDDTKGVWKQEGVATKQGSNYMGVVSHFTFWNAGDLAGSVNLSVTFIDSVYSKPSVYKLVVIARPDSTSRNNYTDSLGKVSGLVPVNEVLNMKILDNCGTTLYSQNIGPFSTNTDLGNIKVSFSNCNLPVATVSGTIVNCNNMAVTNGYVQVIAGYNKFSAPINNDGSFNISYNSGNAIGTLTAYDSGSGDSTKPVSINVLQGSVNIGQVIACTAITSATVAGFTYSVSGPFVPVTVAFSNTSTNATSYVWDFGDGTGSTLVNPEHIYSTAGDYTVKLIVTGSSGKGDSTLKILHLVSQANDTYINLTLNGISYSWTSHQYELSGGRTDTGSVSFTSIKADSTGGSFPTMYILCTIRHDNAPAGNVPTGNYPFGLYTVLNSTSYNTYEPNGSSETNVTQYESVGGYITGSATGWIKNFPPPITDSFPFTCTYKVKRIQ